MDAVGLQGSSAPAVPGRSMILNLTQHAPTADQVAAGVVNLPEDLHNRLVQMLTFQDIPSPEEIRGRAMDIAELAAEWFNTAGRGPDHQVMIGGAPYLMGRLEHSLYWWGINPLYAFSIRESIEENLPDGRVVKRNVFRHSGFVQGDFDPYDGNI